MDAYTIINILYSFIPYSIVCCALNFSHLPFFFPLLSLSKHSSSSLRTHPSFSLSVYACVPSLLSLCLWLCVYYHRAIEGDRARERGGEREDVALCSLGAHNNTQRDRKREMGRKWEGKDDKIRKKTSAQDRSG